MKLQFDSNQQYQIDAINSVVGLFEGQPLNKGDFEIELENQIGQQQLGGNLVVGNRLLLVHGEIIKNLHQIQESNEIEKSKTVNLTLSAEDGEISLTEDGNGISMVGKDELKEGLNFSLEMETGTGKTYVYLRTIHELSRKYGFKKFIIVVPSIAIKEGVIKR